MTDSGCIQNLLNLFMAILTSLLDLRELGKKPSLNIKVCLLFTLMVIMMAKDPIKTLYNYPPKIQERVKSLPQYQGQIPTKKNKLAVKLAAAMLFTVILSLVLRYINGYTTFLEGFGYGFLLWTIVNAYDALVLDICWFCHDPRFVFEGTEDMVDEYHNYWFHIKGSLIGEGIALVVCSAVGLIIEYLL